MLLQRATCSAAVAGVLVSGQDIKLSGIVSMLLRVLGLGTYYLGRVLGDLSAIASSALSIYCWLWILLVTHGCLRSSRVSVNEHPWACMPPAAWL